MTGVVSFKSINEIWKKEHKGLKKNTMRNFILNHNDHREHLLQRFIKGLDASLNVEIINKETLEHFRREISDITYFRGWYIISWW